MSAKSAHPLAVIRRRLGVFAWSRLVLVVVLLLGQVLTPAVATRCDVGDAIAAAGARDATAVGDDAAAAAMADAGRPDVGDCCDGGCIDCCLHASPVLASPLRLPTAAFISSVPLPRTPSVARSDYPVDIRPPIAD